MWIDADGNLHRLVAVLILTLHLSQGGLLTSSSSSSASALKGWPTSVCLFLVVVGALFSSASFSVLAGAFFSLFAWVPMLSRIPRVGRLAVLQWRLLGLVASPFLFLVAIAVGSSCSSF